MSLVCIVLAACTVVSEGQVTCEVLKSECQSIDEKHETELRVKCDKAPNCIEISPKIFVIRQSTPPKPAGGQA